MSAGYRPVVKGPLSAESPSLALGPEKRTGCQYAQSVDCRAQEVSKVPPIECEQYIGARQRGEYDRFVLGCVESDGPEKSERILFNDDRRTQSLPSTNRRGMSCEVISRLSQYPRRNQQAPVLAKRVVEDLARSASAGDACSHSDTAIEKDSQWPARNRAPSASSSAIIAASSSAE